MATYLEGSITGKIKKKLCYSFNDYSSTYSDYIPCGYSEPFDSIDDLLKSVFEFLEDSAGCTGNYDFEKFKNKNQSLSVGDEIDKSVVEDFEDDIIFRVQEQYFLKFSDKEGNSYCHRLD